MKSMETALGIGIWVNVILIMMNVIIIAYMDKMVVKIMATNVLGMKAQIHVIHSLMTVVFILQQGKVFVNHLACAIGTEIRVYFQF